MNPLITIVTVTYNAVDCIESTIVSIVNQTYNDVEYIIVDGGSTDGTLDIVEKYRNRVSKVISESDSGIYDAMNKGLAMASGEWICFINAGDLLYDEHVLANVFAGKKYNENVALICGSRVSYSRSMHVKCVFPAAIGLSPERNTYRLYIPACHQATFFRTKVHQRHPYKCEIYKIKGDWACMAEILDAGADCAVIDDIICWYKMDGVSAKLTISAFREGDLVMQRKTSIFFKLAKVLLQRIRKIVWSLFPDKVAQTVRSGYFKRAGFVTLEQKEIKKYNLT